MIPGPYLGQITSGKWVGTQTEKCPDRGIERYVSDLEITS